MSYIFFVNHIKQQTLTVPKTILSFIPETLSVNCNWHNNIATNTVYLQIIIVFNLFSFFVFHQQQTDDRHIIPQTILNKHTYTHKPYEQD